MRQLAIVIGNPCRDNDVRVDIVEVPENYDYDKVKSDYQSKLLGHFEILHITERLNLNAKI